ncbi:MAG: DUF308 domain-containing protein [Candidatus Marsarchaeota archaeon]|nr:DUF308 domain-containing protein [Candidatus Marsarchaeota archaeon]
MEIATTTSRWLYALRGIAAIVFGIVILVWPGISLAVFVTVFGAFAIVYGVIALVSGLLRTQSSSTWGWQVAVGIIGIVAGLATFFWPGITLLLLVYFIAAWAIATGIGEIAAAIEFGGQMRGEWLLVIAGVLAIIVGIYMLIFPGAGALALLLLIAWFAIFYGFLQLIHMFLPVARTTRV